MKDCADSHKLKPCFWTTFSRAPTRSRYDLGHSYEHADVQERI